MNIIDNLRKITENKRVFIFGYGTMGGTAHFTLHRLGYEIEGIIDSDENKQGITVGGVTIISPYELMYYDKEEIIVFVCSDNSKDEVSALLESMGFNKDESFSMFFLDGRSEPFSEFNPQIGWCRGDLQIKTYYHSNLENPRTILTLGGSTTDSSLNGFFSWPELLYRKINVQSASEKSYKVYNAGIAGYCSSQEMLSFITYGMNEKPDIVISYSGYNDAAGVLSYEYNDFRTVKTLEELRSIAKNEGKDNSLVFDFGFIPGDFAELWFKNIRIIHGICEEYGIKHIQILQPNLLVAGNLDDVEKDICTLGPYKEICNNIESFYRQVKKMISEFEWIFDFTDIFEDLSVYIDTCHVKQEGNEIIASKVYELMKNKGLL